MSDNQHYLTLLKIPVWTVRQEESGVAEAPIAHFSEIAASIESSVRPATSVAVTDLVGQEKVKEIVSSASHKCTLCKLHVGCTQMIKGDGSKNAQLFVVTEAPTFHEDLAGKPFAEEANVLFTHMIQSIGYMLDDVYVTPYIKCSPYQEFITPKEEALCYQHLHAELELIKPQKILLLGRNVAKYFLKRQQSFDELRGIPLAFNELGYEIAVYVSYNPYQLLKFPEEKRKAWQDIKRLKSN